MKELKINILAFVDDSQPGWVRCAFNDAFGKEWFITEKGPVVSEIYSDEKSDYPVEGSIKCSIVEDIDDDKVVIDLDNPWAISAEGGETIFTVSKGQLI